MKTIEIRVPELGNASGTCNWVAEKLEQLSNSLQLSETKSGLPCLTYESPTDKDKENKPKRYIFCKPVSIDEMGFKTYGNYSIISPIDNDYCCQNGIFTYLTPKASDIVNDFILKVADEFILKLEEL